MAAAKCVPASLALLALRQSGHNLKPGTLRMWVHRGHITRGPGGYDLAEILAYLDRRTAGNATRLGEFGELVSAPRASGSDRCTVGGVGAVAAG